MNRPRPGAASTATEGVAAGVAYSRSGAGVPLVLIHGLGADRHVWDPVVPLLAVACDVIAVDLPGFGKSAPIRDAEPTPARLAAAVAGLIGELGVGGGRGSEPVDVAVAGNSLGAWVALELAADARTGAGAETRAGIDANASTGADAGGVRIGSVCGIATAGLWAQPLAPKPETARSIARLARPFLGGLIRIGPVRRAALSGTAAHPERVPTADATRLIRAYAGAPGFTAVNRAMRSRRFTGWERIDAPVTLAWCERDCVLSRPRQVPPVAHEVWLPDCGHTPMFDDPQLVADTILDSGVRDTELRRAGDAVLSVEARNAPARAPARGRTPPPAHKPAHPATHTAARPAASA